MPGGLFCDAAGRAESEQMNPIVFTSDAATPQVPIVLPSRAKQTEVSNFDFQMDLLRRRQLHRKDVQEKLCEITLRRAWEGRR